MARVLTPKDARTIMNLLVKEATGQDSAIQVVDSSSFVAAGETVLRTGVENTLNALSMLNIRTAVKVSPYSAKFDLIRANTVGLYKARLRKISYYAKPLIPDGSWNTDAATNLHMGYDNGTNGSNSTKSMWEQNPAIPLELNFSGMSVYEDSLTVYEDALKVAFSSEEDFLQFYRGEFAEKANDLESVKEAFSRMTLLNRIIGTYAMGNTNLKGSVVNLTKAYNDFYQTSYTSEELLSTYLESFLGFMLSEIEIISNRMTNRSLLYHWSPEKQVSGVDYVLLRHTPKSKQRLFIIDQLMSRAKTLVLPSVFNSELLTTNYEAVDYWQNINEPYSVKGKAAIPNVSAPAEQTVTDEVSIDNVVACLFDEDALMVDFVLDRMATSPLEARKFYRTTFWEVVRNSINDYTENFVLFTMENEE